MTVWVGIDVTEEGISVFLLMVGGTTFEGKRKERFHG
jgi:hypothetical protein